MENSDSNRQTPKQMARANILILATLCIVFGAGLIQAHFNPNIPKEFFYYDPEFALRPQKVEDLGNNRVVFKFGDEKNRMSHLWLTGIFKANRISFIQQMNDILFLICSHSITIRWPGTP